MDEHTFNTKIISGHRVTIREDVFDELELREGEKVRVTIGKTKSHMREHAVITG